MTTLKYGKCTVRTNIDGVLSQLDSAANLPSRIWAAIWNTALYAVFVEFGTYKMPPAAMLRNSLPAIETEFMREWQALSFPPTEQSLLDLLNRIVKFALAEVIGRTPEKSGHLKESWDKEDAQSA